ncbi:unnamed protein product, partial [Rotaria magnacalcarata]
KCVGAGLYLQSSDEQRSTQCTYLKGGHNYLSDSNTLYLNFYSRTPTVRGGFWLVYEGSHPNAEVHLHCGPRHLVGIASATTSSPISIKLPPASSLYNYGWNRLAFHNPPNSTTQIKDAMTHVPSILTTPRLIQNTYP